MSSSMHSKMELIEWLNKRAFYIDKFKDVKYSLYYMKHFNCDYTPYNDLQSPYNSSKDIDFEISQNNDIKYDIYDTYKNKEIHFDPSTNHFNVNYIYKRLNERFNNYNKTIPVIDRDNNNEIRYYNKDIPLRLNKEHFYGAIKEFQN